MRDVKSAPKHQPSYPTPPPPRLRRWLASAVLLSVATSPVTRSTCGTEGVAITSRTIDRESLRVGGGAPSQIDLLFVIDNSPSMIEKQRALGQAFENLEAVLTRAKDAGSAAHYHIGVVTTDLGAGTFALGDGQCQPRGDNGRLVTRGAAADAACASLGGGLAFVDYDQVSGVDNLNGMSLAIALGCISAVGESGCGFESPLEAAYRALHDDVPGNEGFLRDEAALGVVFVTDEDDCSAPPTTDLFDPEKTGQYGALLSYRCSRFGYVCEGGPPPYGPSGGPLVGCRPATEAEGGLLFDVERYIGFFTRPRSQGGVKTNPADVFLASIAAPASPIESVLVDPNPIPPGPYTTCPGPSDGKTCDVAIQRSCISTGNPTRFGDPALRLDAVVTATPSRVQASICDADYGEALALIGRAAVDQLRASCLSHALVQPGVPDCVVEDVTVEAAAELSAQLPRCGAPGASRPCWEMLNKLAEYDDTGCGETPRADTCKLPMTCTPVVRSDGTRELYMIAVLRDELASPSTRTRASCAIIR